MSFGRMTRYFCEMARWPVTHRDKGLVGREYSLRDQRVNMRSLWITSCPKSTACVPGCRLRNCFGSGQRGHLVWSWFGFWFHDTFVCRH